jgi:uncharacterized protein with NRDE domain
MCLILFAHKAHPGYPLILAANRDEAYTRPAAPAAYWHDHPHVYGGRDLDKGGSWLGLTRSGRIAAVTNFRDGNAPKNAPLSRGELVSGFVTSHDDAATYLERVRTRANRYNGFILIAGELDALYWYSNRGPGVERIAPGVHGLSNHLLDTPWPKITRSRQALEALLGAGEDELTAALFDVLADRSGAPDHELPDTGVGLRRERELSPIFISGTRYGTRASTVVLVDGNGGALFIERSFGPGGKALGEVVNHFHVGVLTPSAAGAERAAHRA